MSPSSASQPLVSVVITTYNQEHYIARAIDSVLAQICDFAFELIVADDCSSDATTDICRRMATEHPDIITVITNEHNLGLQANYYNALLRTRGRYIADLGGDDFWTDRHKLARQVDVLERNPGVVMVHTAWQYFDERTRAYSRPSYPAELSHCFEAVSAPGEMFLPVMTNDASVLIHSCTWMFRRDAFLQAYNDDPDMFRNPDYACEDRQLATALSRSGSVAYLLDITTAYSVGKDSMTRREDAAKLFKFYMSTTRLVRYMQLKYSVSDADVCAFYTSRLRFLIGLAYKSRDRRAIEQAVSFALEVGITLPLSSRIKAAISHTFSINNPTI